MLEKKRKNQRVKNLKNPSLKNKISLKLHLTFLTRMYLMKPLLYYDCLVVDKKDTETAFFKTSNTARVIGSNPIATPFTYIFFSTL